MKTKNDQIKLSYIPSRDELRLELRPVQGPPTNSVGPFQLWADAKGNVQAIVITGYSKMAKQFREDYYRMSIHRVDSDVIAQSRRELLKRLERKFRKLSLKFITRLRGTGAQGQGRNKTPM